MKHAIIKIFSKPEYLLEALVRDFIQRAHIAIKAKSIFRVVLSGGNTAIFFFDALAAQPDIPWNKIQLFFGDERYVSPEDEASNYYQASKHLFSRVTIPPENIYRIPTECIDPENAAKNYEKTLQKIFALKENEAPHFDLVYLGLGADGHTASLMPESEIVKAAITHKNTDLVTSLWVEKLNMYRISLTPHALNNSTNISFIVMGKSKAAAIENTLKGMHNPAQYPAQLINCTHEKIVWFLDELAASQLNKPGNLI